MLSLNVNQIARASSYRSHLPEEQPLRGAKFESGNNQQQSLIKLNTQLDGNLSDDALQQTTRERDRAVGQVTGNRNTDSYDVSVAAIAQRDGVSYNQAVENGNKTIVELKTNMPMAAKVEELPWEVEPIQSRVDELMKTESLSHDAAVVLAMTERVPSTNGVEVTLDEEWRDDFAVIVSRSGNELEAWAASQDTGAITFVSGDNDIFVTMRADGMLEITSSLDGVQQGAAQIVDPSLTDRIVINAGSGDDSIEIDSSVTANLVLAGGTGRDFIYGGGGNDIIIGGTGDDLVRGGAGSDIVLGSDGNDNLEGGKGGDLLFGGLGDDHAQGDAGNDLLFGGAGEDSLYGNKGQDLVMGNEGNDYLDGGEDNDLVQGGVGDDIVSGGKGDDTVHGNAGADTLIGASGADLYGELDSADTLIVDSTAAAESSYHKASGADIRLVESDANAGSHSVSIANNQREEFVTRVEDDLETLRSLESGQSMLNALDQARRDSYRSDRHFLGINLGGGYSGHRVNLKEIDATQHLQYVRDPVNNATSRAERGYAAPGGGVWKTTDPLNSPTSGTSVTIGYNPSANKEYGTGVATPPIIVLFHELAHGYNMVTGTGLDGKYTGTDSNNNSGTIDNTERQAVGLVVDHDNDPSTPEQLVSSHPFSLTENGLRTELDLMLRPFY